MSTFGLIMWGPISQVFQHVSGKKTDQPKQLLEKTTNVESHTTSRRSHQVTLEEFIDGIMRCKGPARAIDQATKLKGTAVYSAGRNCTSDVKDYMEIERDYITVH